MQELGAGIILLISIITQQAVDKDLYIAYNKQQNTEVIIQQSNKKITVIQLWSYNELL